MRRLPRVLLALLLSLLVVAAVPSMARADDDPPSDWRIPRYDVTADVAKDGTTQVTIDMDFDFGGERGRGPFITLPLRQRTANPDEWRMTDVTVGQVTSPSGANTEVWTDEEDGNLVIRIGNEDVYFTGRQTYRITYSIRGLIALRQAQSGLDEFNWNVIGTGWQVPIDAMSAKVTGPVGVEGVACFEGSRFSDPCTATSAGSRATYSASSLRPGDGVQIVAGFPSGTFVGAEPRITKRYHAGNVLAVTPWTVGGTLGLAALGIAAVLAAGRRGSRDEVYLGLAPGMRPAPGQQGSVGRGVGSAPVAVAFRPPRDARPGEIGTLVDATADNVDVTATIIDLAVRGHMTIAKVEGEAPVWEFTRVRDVDDPLQPYENTILQTMFKGKGDTVTTKKLRNKKYHRLMPQARDDLYDRVTKQLKWFTRRPAETKAAVVVAGIAIIVGGIVLGAVAGFLWGWGLIGLAFLAIGIVLLATASKFPARTAEGSAVLAEAKGFELYLRTAEADQIRFEEGIDVFSRYLPYAIVYGVADRWAGVFEKLAREGAYVADTSWYIGSDLGFRVGFISSMNDLSRQMSSAMTAATASQTAATSGSSGGSGFSGGGGFGGGGGGGW